MERDDLRVMDLDDEFNDEIVPRPVTDADLASLGYVRLADGAQEIWERWAKDTGFVKLDGIDVSLALGRVLDKHDLRDLDLLMDLSRAVLAALEGDTP